MQEKAKWCESNSFKIMQLCNCAFFDSVGTLVLFYLDLFNFVYLYISILIAEIFMCECAFTSLLLYTRSIKCNNIM